MVSTPQKAMASAALAASPATASDVATQTEVSGKHAAIPLLGCRLCPSLLSVSDSSSAGYACGRCAQAEELLSLVAELCEEVMLRSIRESERETGWWKHPPATRRQTQEPAATQETKGPPSHQAATTQKTRFPPSRQAVGGDLGQGGEWKQGSAQHGR